MSLADNLRDPKQRIVAGVAAAAILITGLVLARMFFSSGGAAKPDQAVEAAVQNLQPEAPADPSKEEIEKEATAAGEPVDMTPSSGKHIRRKP